MLQTMGNNMDPGLSQMILSDIARLRKMPALAHSIKNYQPQPDPAKQREQRLTIEKLAWEIEKLKSETNENNTDARVNVAKAANLQSETDKANLDFVEQESGVHQARELQKIGEQARSQTELKREEHRLKQQEESRKELRKYLSNAA